MLSIDEAIIRERKVAEEQRELFRLCPYPSQECNGADICKCLKNKHDGCIKCAEEHEQLAEWLEKLKEMRKNQGQIADFWYQEGISRESKLIFDKIEEIKNRYNVEDFAIIGVLIKVQEIALEIAEELKEKNR